MNNDDDDESKHTLDESVAYVLPEEEVKSPYEIVAGHAVHNISKYSTEKKVQAVVVYFLNQSYKKTARMCTIPEGTLKDWSETVWWKEAYQRIKKEKNEELDGKISAILDRSIALISKRLKTGDATVSKDGTLIYKPVAARDVALISAILFDKRALMRGDPTSRTEKVSTDEVLANLMDSFQKLADKSVRKEKVINPREVLGAVVSEE